MTNPAQPSSLDARIRRTIGRASRRTRRFALSRRPQRVIAILGMHRAGTSSLAGSLEAAGLFLGDVRGRSEWNQKGNRESRYLMELHEDVLKANDGAWHKPPERVVWSDEHKARRDRYIRQRLGVPVWGFKDPRTLLVLEGWTEAVAELEFVATLRHPLSVAHSLQRRSGKPQLEPWLALWLAYNTRLLDLLSEREFPLIDFDLSAAAYQARLASVIEELRLPGAGGDETFFEASLRHDPRAGEPVPDEVSRVYRELQEIAARQAGA